MTAPMKENILGVCKKIILSSTLPSVPWGIGRNIPPNINPIIKEHYILRNQNRKPI